MGLSSLNKESVFDPIRDCWVRATPEERVRQRLIQKMIGPLGFPKGLLAVEKPLKDLTHLAGVVVSERRIDLLCYAKLDVLIYPLLLVECKAVPLTEQGIDQLMGYNHHVGAPFIAAVNAEEVQFAYREGETYRFCSFLPAFKELIAWVKR